LDHNIHDQYALREAVQLAGGRVVFAGETDDRKNEGERGGGGGSQQVIICVADSETDREQRVAEANNSAKNEPIR
jgi:hypothetical protein